LSNQQPDLAGKRLEILREMIPGLSRVAVLANGHNLIATLNVDEVQAAAPKLGLEVNTLDVKRADDIAPAINQLKGRTQAIYVVGDHFVFDNQIQINTLALVARLPTMHNARGYVETGGLVSYGTSFSDLFRRAGDYVDKILKGARPADISRAADPGWADHHLGETLGQRDYGAKSKSVLTAEGQHAC
jgi:putative tryptophan/tyrosine transport system substrate-binding protein